MFKKGDHVRRFVGGKERIVMFDGLLDDEDDEFVYIFLPTSSERDQGWKFDRVHGYEVDEELGWGMQTGGPLDGDVLTGSWLELVES